MAYTDLMIGVLCSELGEHERAAGHVQQALAFAQALGDPRWEAYGLLNLGMTALARESHDEVRHHLGQSLAMYERAVTGTGRLASATYSPTSWKAGHDARSLPAGAARVAERE